MTNLKTTIKTLSIAAAVSFTMNAMAYSVPGLPAGFDQVEVDTGTGYVAGAGAGAITNINNIVNAVGGTGGLTIQTTDYWNAFIGSTDQNYFDYATAKSMIEELVYTVDGKTFHEETDGVATSNSQTYDYVPATGRWQSRTVPGNNFSDYGFRLSTDVVILSEYESAGYSAATAAQDAEWAAKTSVSGNAGNVVDGHIDLSFAGGNRVLGALGMGSIDVNRNNAKNTDTTDVSNVVTDNTNSNLTAAQVQTSVTATTYVDHTGSARVVPEAYNNANELIKLIAAEVDTGRLLDVVAAAEGVQTLINQHNGFLSANVLMNAKSLKAALKNMALQQGASATGQAAFGVCDNQFSTGNNVEEACTRVGQKFQGFAGQIDSTATASNYNSALVSLSAYAQNLIDFNTVATGYNAGNASSEIIGEFGAIESINTQTKFGTTAGFGNSISDSTSDLDSDGIFEFDFTIGTANGTGSITK